jgi:hypothetical protein
MGIYLIGTLSMFLVLVLLFSTGIAILIRKAMSYKQMIDYALEQTHQLKAVKWTRGRQLPGEFTLLQADTAVYLQSVTVFSKGQEQLSSGSGILFPTRQFKGIPHRNCPYHLSRSVIREK